MAPGGGHARTDEVFEIRYVGASRLTIYSTTGMRRMPVVVPCYFDELGLEMNALLDTAPHTA